MRSARSTLTHPPRPALLDTVPARGRIDIVILSPYGLPAPATPLAVNALSQGGPHDETMETVLGSGPGSSRSAGGAGHRANQRRRQEQGRSADRVCHRDGAGDEVLDGDRYGRPVHAAGGATGVVHGGRGADRLRL